MPGSPWICRGCGVTMLRARMPSGSFNPLNVEEVEPVAGAKGVVAYNPVTGGGMMVIAANIPDDVERWRNAGATFHTSHFATCPERARFGKKR